MSERRYIVVTGSSKSHLLRTMKLLDERKQLLLGITSFIPKNSRTIRYLPKKLRIKFLSRLENVEGLSRVSHLFPEIVFQLSRILQKRHFYVAGDFIASMYFLAYSHLANKEIKVKTEKGGATLLVRAGFGTKIDKEKHFFICDASLAHPMTLPTLLESGAFGLTSIQELSRVDRLIIDDVSKADLILVNSNFVRDSFIYAGVNESKISVAYLPPLSIFRQPVERDIQTTSEIQLLFAGGLEKRKGISLIQEIIVGLEARDLDFCFKLIGNWGTIERDVQKELLNNPRVHVQTWLPESELAVEMANSDIFVFPSFAEGGARVVSEAMSMGMAVVTTWNSGTPITHGYDGIICPLDSNVFINWISELISNQKLRQAIEKNARTTVQTKLSDETYVQSLVKLSSKSEQRKLS